MPNRSLDLTPRFDGDIDAEIVDTEISVVDGSGYAHVNTEYAHHLVAWAPFREDGQIRTTSYNQQRKERVQSFVQEGGGGVNIGTEEWNDKKLVILILNQTLEDPY